MTTFDEKQGSFGVFMDDISTKFGESKNKYLRVSKRTETITDVRTKTTIPTTVSIDTAYSLILAFAEAHINQVTGNYIFRKNNILGKWEVYFTVAGVYTDDNEAYTVDYQQTTAQTEETVAQYVVQVQVAQPN